MHGVPSCLPLLPVGLLHVAAATAALPEAKAVSCTPPSSDATEPLSAPVGHAPTPSQAAHQPELHRHGAQHAAHGRGAGPAIPQRCGLLPSRQPACWCRCLPACLPGPSTLPACPVPGVPTYPLRLARSGPPTLRRIAGLTASPPVPLQVWRAPSRWWARWPMCWPSPWEPAPCLACWCRRSPQRASGVRPCSSLPCTHAGCGGHARRAVTGTSRRLQSQCLPCLAALGLQRAGRAAPSDAACRAGLAAGCRCLILRCTTTLHHAARRPSGGAGHGLSLGLQLCHRPTVSGGGDRAGRAARVPLLRRRLLRLRRLCGARRRGDQGAQVRRRSIRGVAGVPPRLPCPGFMRCVHHCASLSAAGCGVPATSTVALACSCSASSPATQLLLCLPCLCSLEEIELAMSAV